MADQSQIALTDITLTDELEDTDIFLISRPGGIPQSNTVTYLTIKDDVFSQVVAMATALS